MRIVSYLLILLILASCGNRDINNAMYANEDQKLPYLGQYQLVESNGKTDTIHHTVGEFKLVNQDSMEISNQDVEGKIYVADFFFTSCPTLCPKMKTQMLRVYDSTLNDPDVLILSHTIDPEYDSVAVLKGFADQLGVTSDKWHFLTGKKEDIYKLGQTSYMVTAIEDPTEPGGYIHSGAFLLVDKEGRIRGVYDGTNPVEVNDLLKDLKKLQKEHES